MMSKLTDMILEGEELPNDDAEENGDAAERLLARLRRLHPEMDVPGKQDVQIKEILKKGSKPK